MSGCLWPCWDSGRHPTAQPRSVQHMWCTVDTSAYQQNVADCHSLQGKIQKKSSSNKMHISQFTKNRQRAVRSDSSKQMSSPWLPASQISCAQYTLWHSDGHTPLSTKISQSRPIELHHLVMLEKFFHDPLATALKLQYFGRPPCTDRPQLVLPTCRAPWLAGDSSVATAVQYHILRPVMQFMIPTRDFAAAGLSSLVLDHPDCCQAMIEVLAAATGSRNHC